MRLVDADLLDEEVMYWFMCMTGNPKPTTVVNECRSSFRNMIDEQPTVDAVPVIHGNWYKYRLSKLFKWTCTVCHSDVDEKTPFCPWCGAKMDGKKVQE